MKIITGIFFLLVFIPNLVATAPLVPYAGSMTATINSTTWTATSIIGAKGSAITTNSIGVKGSQDSTGTVMALFIPVGTSTGTYQINGNMYNITYYKDSTAYYIARTGSISVSDYTNGIISGTFQGSLVNKNNSSDSITISNGAFAAAVQ